MQEGTWVLCQVYVDGVLTWKGRFIAKIMRIDTHDRYVLKEENTGKEHLACEEQLEELNYLDIVEGEIKDQGVET